MSFKSFWDPFAGYTSGSGSTTYGPLTRPTTNARPTVQKRSPQAQLAGLQAMVTAEGFQWSYPPGTGFRGRGVYPTWAHVRSWYDGAVEYGYDPEDIGFELHDLYDAWHEYVTANWPGDIRNNAVFDIQTEHRSPFDSGFQFPDNEYPNP